MNSIVKICLSATLPVWLSACGVLDFDSDRPSSFRAEDEGSWYHSIEVETWVRAGGDRDVLEATLERIELATGPRKHDQQPDTIIDYGPGHWTYEFVRAGDAAYEQARSQTATQRQYEGFNQATLYYHLASAPHLNNPNAQAALAKSREAYQQAANLLPGNFEQISIDALDRQFGAYLHIPPESESHAVLVLSNGSDMSKETTLNYYRNHLMPRGIALLSLDFPGLGQSSAYHIADGVTDKLHVAAVDWVRQHPDINPDRIFVQGISFGGHAATRYWLSHEPRTVAGVIAMCGPLNSPFLASPNMYGQLPTLTIDGVKTRLGLPLNASFEQLADKVRPLALQNQGLLTGDSIDTPLLVVSTDQDPVSPLMDWEPVLQRATQAQRVIIHEDGHCPAPYVREPIAAAWIESVQR